MSQDARKPVPIVNADALKSEIRAVFIDLKGNRCPIAVRMAWYMGGTYDAKTGTGGSDGCTIRFPPESTDPANQAFAVIRDLLEPVKRMHPEISYADLYTFAGCAAVEFLGGPVIPFNFGRTDNNCGSSVAQSRRPNPSQGLAHLREVFGRMGFNDRELVALSGGHTLGRMHTIRSGYDGAWTRNLLKFDNEYYRNLIEATWVPRGSEWKGNPQCVDNTGQVAMLPTDLALISEHATRAIVEEYAKSQDLWFADFAKAFGKLVALGCPPYCQPGYIPGPPSALDKASAEFRDHAMHGNVERARAIASSADVHQADPASGRTALHKAAFYNQVDMINYLLRDCKLNPNVQDLVGDTALHEAARFGHAQAVKALLAGNADVSLKNKKNYDALTFSTEFNKDECAAVLRRAKL